MRKRCINIDWLEIFCTEAIDGERDPQYFSNCGYYVDVRQYGTPQYAQMFTIYEADRPIIEVRRLPYSIKQNGGIFNKNDCHIRLCNRACYQPRVIEFLRNFLIAHQYTYKCISRIDICLDLQKFDNNMLPENLVAQYLENKISKINQCNIAAHGIESILDKIDVSSESNRDKAADLIKNITENVSTYGKDAWQGRAWNSIKWGSPTSNISTKFYNKTLELACVNHKFYIEDAWKECGFDMDKPTWRLEFSIKSSIKGFVKMNDGEFAPSSLSLYDTQEKLWWAFSAIAAKYFDFRKVEMIGDKKKRKDRCEKIKLFNFKDNVTWKPIQLTSQIEPTRTDNILMKRLIKMLEDGIENNELYHAVQVLLSYLKDRKRMIPQEYQEKLLLNFE